VTIRNGSKVRSDPQREVMLARRRNFLLAFEEHGTISAACRALGIDRSSVIRWQADPEFAEKLHVARVAFAEMLEGIALERVRNPDKNRGSDVLLLGLLNANLPSKYRPQFAMSEDSARDLIIEWRKAAKEVKREEPKEEGGSLPEPLQAEVFEILMKKKEDAPKEREDEEKEIKW
jgi:hypothetical protein